MEAYDVNGFHFQGSFRMLCSQESSHKLAGAALHVSCSLSIQSHYLRPGPVRIADRAYCRQLQVRGGNRQDPKWEVKPVMARNPSFQELLSAAEA